MTWIPQHIALLIFRKSAGNATHSELQELDEWAMASPGNRLLLEQVTEGDTLHHWLQQEEKDRQSGLEEQLLQRIMTDITDAVPAKRSIHLSTDRHKHIVSENLFRYAAAVLIIISVAALLLQKRMAGLQTANNAITIAADSGKYNGPLLTLADGSIIRLNKAANGALTSQGDINIVKQKDDKLTYSRTNQAKSSQYNTLTTPEGAIYQIELPDGTNAWLNACSSIRFPVSFSEERVVTVTGEVYLEVTASPQHPFIVKTKGRTITALGTSFNISAYDDEAVPEVTLISGSIQVANSTHSLLLTPGETAGIPYSGIMKPVQADADRAIAWKSGWFRFEEAGIEQIMNELKRWYNIEVHYNGTAPLRRYSGAIKKDLPLPEVLGMLEKTKLHFKVSNRIITVAQ